MVKMCSCDVHRLSHGLCLIVFSRGHLWWLSRCQLFGAYLGSHLHDSCFSFAQLFIYVLIFLFVYLFVLI